MNITVIEENGRKNLIVNGVCQSTYPPSDQGYWKYMIPETPVKKALILGVGAGTIPRMLLEKNPDCQILGVDYAKDVIQVAIEHFHLGELNMKLVIEDAFEYINTINEQFDLIIVDLFNGHEFPLKCVSPSFLGRCQQLLEKGGKLYINAPNIDQGITMQLPTRIKVDTGGCIVYSITRDYDIIEKQTESGKEKST